MPNETTALALAPPAEALHEPEYQALVGALSESARGRAFLAEHARRTRAAETSTLLAALDRIEAVVSTQGAPSAAQPPRMELQALFDNLRAARPAVETSPLPTKAAQLAALLDLMESRLADLLASAPEPVEIGDTAPEQAAVTHGDDPPRARWADAPPEALTVESDAMLWRPEAFPQEATPIPARIDEAGECSCEEDRSPASTLIGGSDALAQIMALSEEERIALFT